MGHSLGSVTLRGRRPNSRSVMNLTLGPVDSLALSVPKSQLLAMKQPGS